LVTEILQTVCSSGVKMARHRHRYDLGEVLVQARVMGNRSSCESKSGRVDREKGERS
jgi:hypothetical protein